MDEQHQEFAVLRAVGVKPGFIFVLAIQSIIVLASSFAVGISFGTIITLLILLPQDSYNLHDFGDNGFAVCGFGGDVPFEPLPALSLLKARF